MSEINLKLKTYDELTFEITRLNTDKYLLEQKLQQKEKSINKAIKLLKKYRNRKDTWGLWCMEYVDNAEVIHALGGEIR